ncbi:CPXCG motif-containing cysteine-rich protein [Aliidiomarina sanyensis]|uniref:CPXCG motif-containing cysteine-rich protein n=1 Tax=Aliidiomarina sanyensis TaxID=1249555 RepID=A0A432WS75_9GAMM|nr:CPXCG motif-containing cysteine-rich protein [Aliidiomarina sanyensis]RUO36609.1 CPXCG motif-containing cysteine-rich protein [Aliidiomarina sanyensis]
MDDAKLFDARVHCPHCGHTVHLDVDTSEDEQNYEDECPNCGDSIYVTMHREIGDDKIHLRVTADDEQYY